MSSRRLREIYISHHSELKKYGRKTGGSRKFGVPVSYRTTLFLGRLFSRHLLWRAVRG